MSIINSQPLIGASGQGGYNLTKSLRFRSSASAYLNRTPASAGNRKTWTWSGWVKRGKLGSFNPLLQANYSGTPWFVLGFANNDKIEITQTAGSSASWESTAVFRDCSAWYHIVCVVDTTSATSTMNGSSTDRFRLYVNGTQYVISGGSVPSQNADLQVNNTVAHTIGGYGSSFTDGYLAEVNFIDGQALTPSSFGETSTSTGVWIPKKYTGTYGTNGFYLPFTDVATTSGSNAGLGKDFSGNGNYWTTNNISVTSGSTYDSMKDVPTLTDTDTANYCTWNPLNKTSNHTASDGNLTATSSSYGAMASTIGFSSGKWYWEVTCTNRTGTNSPSIGYCNELYNVSSASYLTDTANSGGINSYNGNAATNATSTSYGSAISTNDVVMFAFDADAKKMWVGKNGTWFNSGNPVTATNQYPYTITGSTFFPAINCYTDTYKANFGQQPFAYTPPTGFVALNTFNLPTPTIGATASSQANKYFNAVIYTGNNGTQTIATGFQPDFTWIKVRNVADDHFLYDSVRGATKYLSSNTTGAEGTIANGLTAFASTGFTLGDSGSTNNGSNNFASWSWKANGSGSTNTSGTITSTVSANTTAGFSIATYTGNGTAGATVGHGLGVAPDFIILKNKASSNWWVYPRAMQAAYSGEWLYLNFTFAHQGTASANDAPFYKTNPTSTVFYVAGDGANTSSNNYVAYCFAQVAGYSAFGSYTGNGSSDGTMVFTGFRPRFVMIKRTDSGNNWFILDTARDTFNLANDQLLPNSSAAESTNTDCNIDILSNGFKLRTALDASNGSGGTYIYACFSDVPFKYALAR